MNRRLRTSIFVLLISSAGLLFVSGRSWTSISVTESGFPQFQLSMTGREIEPLVAGCAWALLASAITLLVTRGILQRIVGLIAVTVGVLASFSAVQANGSSANSVVKSFIASKIGLSIDGYTATSNVMWIIAVLLSLIATVAAVVIVLSVVPSEQLSKRYERTVESNVDELTTWQALDQGLDPTTEQSGPTQ